MNVTVTTSQVRLNTSAYADLGTTGQTLVMQNLGDGEVYFDFRTGVTAANGIRLSPNGAYELTNWNASMDVFLISDSSADVRYGVVG